MVSTELPTFPAVVRGKVLHMRRKPWNHGLSFTTYEWLLDLDQPLPTSPLARVLPKDHFGGKSPSVRAAVETFAREHGASIEPGDRVIMLASARSVGYVFNPLSVYWCLDAGNDIRWAILEIHNTYGERHAHVIHPDAQGRVVIAKEFYVSPFFEIRGEYHVRLILDAHHVHASVNLHQDDELVFSASFSGTPLPATRSNLLLAAIRTPFASYQTMVRIRAHGIWLWLRRLPVIKRPAHKEQVGMS
jgi:DUF1365 family protein